MYSEIDIEEVFSIYQDESQDPEYISEKTGFDMNKVRKILEILTGRKTKEQSTEDRIVLLSEMISDELKRELELDKLSKSIKDENYFFTEKDVNREYGPTNFHIKVDKVYFEQDMIYIPVKLFFNDKEYEFAALIDRGNDVFYLDMENKESVQQIKRALKKQNWKTLKELTKSMVNDIIPKDFWDVRFKAN